MEVVLQDNDETTFDFNKLPIPLIERIFEYLETYDIVRMRRVTPAFKEYVDGLAKTESSIQPYSMEIRENKFTIYENSYRRRDLPDDEPFASFQIYGNVQLNWIHPYKLRYDSSTIFESSPNFQEFLKNLYQFTVYAIAKGENFLENFCENVKSMENIVEFKLFDETLEDEELVKVISSLRVKRTLNLSIRSKNPFLTQNIIDIFFKTTFGKEASLIINKHPFEIDDRNKEELILKWRDGIHRFFDYQDEESDESSKTLEFPHCYKWLGDAIILALHAKFNHQSIVQQGQFYSTIRFGNRSLICEYRLNF